MRKFFHYCISRLRIAVGGFLKDQKELPDRYPQFQIGRGSYGPLRIETFGDDCKVTIGAFCSFARNVTILVGGEHHTKWITTYPFDRLYFRNSEVQSSSWSKGEISIGNDVWIGEGALILSGAQIGDGAVIGARSVVRGTIPPYSIAVGAPARVLKRRFSPAEIEALCEIRWWEWEDARIAREVPLLMSDCVDEFIRRNLPVGYAAKSPQDKIEEL